MLRYIVARPFQTHEGTHEAGSLAPKSAATWQNIESIVAAGMLYPMVRDDGYENLPAHIFNAVRTRQEIDGLIFVGENPVTFNEWVKSEEVKEAERVQEAQLESMDANRERQALRVERSNQAALVSQVDPRPVQPTYTVASIDAMKEAAEAAAADNQNAAVERDVESENQDYHATPKPPETTVEVGTDGSIEGRMAVPLADGPSGDNPAVVQPTNEGSTDARAESKYSGLTKGQLLEEIEARNEKRTEGRLKVTGNKPDLIAELEEDDPS